MDAGGGQRREAERNGERENEEKKGEKVRREEAVHHGVCGEAFKTRVALSRASGADLIWH